MEYGRMRDDMKLDEAYVLIYNRSGDTAYALYNNRASELNNALDSCTVYGGENDPFEYVVMKIPRKKMYQVASDLMLPDALVAGANRVYLNAMGKGEYVVASHDLTGDVCTIKAYCLAYKLTGMVLNEDVSMTPFQVIEYILTGNKYGTFITGKFRYWYSNENNAKLTFRKGQSLWYVLQVCAAYMGCKIFFTGEDAYLVDFRLTGKKEYTGSIGTDTGTGVICTTEPEIGPDGLSTGVMIPDAVCDFGTIDLYTKDSTRPEYGRVVDAVELGNEGLTTVINQVTVICAGGVKVTLVNNKAKRHYDDTVFDKTLSIEDLKETKITDEVQSSYDHQGAAVASNIIDYRCESQQSVKFTFKEFVNTGGEIHWVPFFPPSARVREIIDTVDNVDVTNTSILNRSIIKPQKLILSSYARNFPDGTSTYKFGVISSVDLQSKLNEMTTAQQNS